MHWTEKTIGLMLQHTDSIGQKLIVIPNCHWTGHEADLLVVDYKHRLIDIEIKISRSDLKADAAKDKWWVRRTWSRRAASALRRDWPPQVWKHYYALPAAIWADSLAETLASPKSGILLLEEPTPMRPNGRIKVKRRAVPNRAAKPVSPGDCLDMARLANLRMWDAIKRLRGISCDPTTNGEQDESNA